MPVEGKGLIISFYLKKKKQQEWSPIECSVSVAFDLTGYLKRVLFVVYRQQKIYVRKYVSEGTSWWYQCIQKTQRFMVKLFTTVT